MLDKNSIDQSKSTLVSQDTHPDWIELFASHIAEKLARFQTILNDTGYQALVIASGGFKHQFQDDLSYPFKANPYFKEWLPLNKRRDAFLVIEVGCHKPTLFLDCAEDIWHSEPQSLPKGFDEPLTIVEYDKFDLLKQAVANIQGAVALVAEQNSPQVPVNDFNPKVIIDAIDFQRRRKTPYEHNCVRQANRLAVPAHLAARDAFLAGASEYEIAQAYLRACQCTESEMPYGIIAGVNQNAAVLHHYELNKEKPTPSLSFLLDAGVDFNGYASDISRTYACDAGSEFAAMIALLNKKQLELVSAGAINKSPVELHELSHRAIAEILIEFGLISVSVEAALASGLTEVFYPHGLGHHLGVNVHDKGSQLANAKGDLLEPSAAYPKLRHTAAMVANQIYTVEPGLYFIPSKLTQLRNSEHSSQVIWPRVEAFIPYGGIRIEDNIILHADNRVENMTRDAFAQ